MKIFLFGKNLKRTSEILEVMWKIFLWECKCELNSAHLQFSSMGKKGGDYGTSRLIAVYSLQNTTQHFFCPVYCLFDPTPQLIAGCYTKGRKDKWILS